MFQQIGQKLGIGGGRKQRSKMLRRQRARREFGIERLEGRELFAGDFRSIDGTGNNLANPQWGSTEEAFLRRAPAEYADGKSAPAGANRASARLISNIVAAHPANDILDENGLSGYVYAWGQFLDHDLDLTLSASPTESFPIAVPTGDPYFDPAATGTKTIPLSRSQFDPSTGVANARQQINTITAFIDGSMVYGSDQATANSLRTFASGKLKTSAGNLLPTDDTGIFFVAGDIRVNENPNLIAMQTLFVREHNRLATRMATDNPTWNDERLYQEARRTVIAEIQAITFNEYLPALLGRNSIAPYRGYNAQVNPGISNEFATAAFRFGHSTLDDQVEFLDNQGNEVHDPLSLRDAFFNTGVVQDVGIDPVLKALASDVAERIDTRVIDDVRNFLFGPPGAGGFDLASLNIQRGRDHGLADYNDARAAFGLPRVTRFSEITRDVAVQNALQQAYGKVNNIDLWVGGLAEDHMPGASVGPTFQKIMAEQFSRLRDGDRFWYERDLQGPALDAARRTTLADVIRRNSVTNNLQDNVFLFRTALAGRVFQQTNPSVGVGGLTVLLQDTAGNTIASTTTRSDGTYRFEKLELGKYKVKLVPPRGVPDSPNLVKAVTLTRGQEILGIDFALSPPPLATR